jgi:hypothetical protein
MIKSAKAIAAVTISVLMTPSMVKASARRIQPNPPTRAEIDSTLKNVRQALQTITATRSDLGNPDLRQNLRRHSTRAIFQLAWLKDGNAAHTALPEAVEPCLELMTELNQIEPRLLGIAGHGALHAVTRDYLEFADSPAGQQVFGTHDQLLKKLRASTLGKGPDFDNHQ